MDHHTDESAVRDYLAALEVRLVQLPTDQSAEILFSVRERIVEAQERGRQSTNEILRTLGSADHIAAGITGAGREVSGSQFPSAQVAGAQLPTVFPTVQMTGAQLPTV